MTDEQALQLGNVLLGAMMLSYAASFLLLSVLIRPRDRLEWSTTLKVGGVTAVLVNAVLLTLGLVNSNLHTRVVVFSTATLLCWWFTVEAYRAWSRRRNVSRPLLAVLLALFLVASAVVLHALWEAPVILPTPR